VNNPVEVLRDIARQIAADTGLEVDEPAFDKAAEQVEQYESVESFLARGGKINVIPAGVCGIDPDLEDCKCGCKGFRKPHDAKAAKRYRFQLGSKK
jgi:hypothetical protein